MGDDRLEEMKKYYDSITLPSELKVTVERGGFKRKGKDCCHPAFT